MSTRTICASASLAVTSAISIIRISGPLSLKVVAKLCNNDELLKTVKPTLTSNYIYDKHGQMVDQAVILLFSKPRSFTGEDYVEIQHHGAPVISTTIVDSCLAYGCVPAQPGEFTRQAVVNKKISLHQAEEIFNLIHAKSLAVVHQSVKMLRNPADDVIKQINNQIVQVIVMFEGYCNFPEDVELDHTDCLTLLKRSKSQLDSIIASSKCFHEINQGLTIALVGKTNVGKSSLVNALAKKDEVIVSDKHGTTRDAIKILLQHKGLCITIIDTPGIRPTDDALEQLSIKKSYEVINKCNHVLLIEDNTGPSDAIVRYLTQHNVPYSLIYSKSDVVKWDSLCFNTVQPGGIEPILTILDQLSQSYLSPDRETHSLHIRYLYHLEHASFFIKEALNCDFAIDMMLEFCRSATSALKEVVEPADDNTTLDSVFSKFCIGK